MVKLFSSSCTLLSIKINTILSINNALLDRFNNHALLIVGGKLKNMFLKFILIEYGPSKKK